jgi:hypothetical protein
LRFRIHHCDERLRISVPGVVGKRNCCIVCALNECGLDQVADRESLAGAQMHRRFADFGCVGPHPHDVVPLCMLERHQHGHELRDARDRNAHPRTVLREDLAGRWILDDVGARGDGRRGRVRSSGESERRDDSGDPDPEDHDRKAT